MEPRCQSVVAALGHGWWRASGPQPVPPPGHIFPRLFGSPAGQPVGLPPLMPQGEWTGAVPGAHQGFLSNLCPPAPG